MPTHGEWTIFVGTAIVFAVTPGPALLYVLARSLRGGRREGTLSAVGNALGTTVHVLATAVGVSALVAASPIAFRAVKYAGAAYLVVLGVKAIRSRQFDPAALVRSGRRYGRSPLLQGVVIETLNPKTAMYFMAVLPHFIHPERAAAAVVLTILGLVVVTIVLAADLLVALAAGRLHERLSGAPRWQERQRAASGALMVMLGVFVAFT